MTMMKAASVCDECPRLRRRQPASRRRYGWPRSLGPDVCLLDAGVVCCGMATRPGCGALCPSRGSPCIGCFGQNDGTLDFERRMLRELAHAVGGGRAGDERGLARADRVALKALLRDLDLARPWMRERVRRHQAACADS